MANDAAFLNRGGRPWTRAIVRFGAVLLVGWLLASWIDPYLDVSSSIAAQAVNAAAPILLTLLVWGLSGRAWFALAIEALVLGALRYADQVKTAFLGIDVVYADFTVLGGLLKNPHLMFGFIRPSLHMALAVIILIAAAIAVWWFQSRRQTRPGAPTAPALRMICLGLAVVGGLYLWNKSAPDAIEALEWQVFSQDSGAHKVGIAGNILLGKMTTRNAGRQPDAKLQRAFWNEPAVLRARQRLDEDGNGNRPDIVIVQSESLFEPAQLCGFGDAPVLKRVAQERPTLAGNLQVPVYGGRTLQTEFEVLSGTPVSFYPGSMFAYYELIDGPFDALPNVLDRIGYRTIAIHPNNRGFWRRDAAMPAMGFQTFLDIGSFLYPRDFSDRGHVRDAALMRAVLAELDAANEPTFITAITIDNHFPWGLAAPANDKGLHLPTTLTGHARAELADYVAHALDADHAYGFLLDALKRRKRPTVVLFYGDHLPPLFSVYRQLCFKDGLRPEDHLPPYRIWANFPITKMPDAASAYLLQGWVARAAGLPLRGHLLANALAGMVAHDPEVGEAERKRVLDEYANIAAANVRARIKQSDGARTVLFGHDRALLTLGKLALPAALHGVSLGDEELHFRGRKGEQTAAAFLLDGGVSSLTLRPYLGASTVGCMKRPSGRGATFEVTGDGQTLYRASVMAQTVRLATIDLRGVRRLTISATQPADAGECGQLHARVAQMKCYAADCRSSGSASPPTARKPSRILSSDPIQGDIETLRQLTPESQRLISDELNNVRWMMARKTASQVGYLPFSLDGNAQLFMHPAEDHPAWIDFDLEGIDALELTPQIKPLTPDCLALNKPGQEAGMVGLRVAIDGRPIMPRTLIDRNLHTSLAVETNGGKVMRIEVDKGNQVSWCDWFDIGFRTLEGPAAPSGPIGNPMPDVPAAIRSIPPPLDH